MSDKKLIMLTCKSCNKEFEFTVTEQLFFEEKGFYDPKTGKGAPIRCHDCRSAKKARNAEREEKPTHEPKQYQVKSSNDWFGAAMEMWPSQYPLFNDKD